MGESWAGGGGGAWKGHIFWHIFAGWWKVPQSSLKIMTKSNMVFLIFVFIKHASNKQVFFSLNQFYPYEEVYSSLSYLSDPSGVSLQRGSHSLFYEWVSFSFCYWTVRATHSIWVLLYNCHMTNWRERWKTSTWIWIPNFNSFLTTSSQKGELPYTLSLCLENLSYRTTNFIIVVLIVLFLVILIG